MLKPLRKNLLQLAVVKQVPLGFELKKEQANFPLITDRIMNIAPPNSRKKFVVHCQKSGAIDVTVNGGGGTGAGAIVTVFLGIGKNGWRSPPPQEGHFDEIHEKKKERNRNRGSRGSTSKR